MRLLLVLLHGIIDVALLLIGDLRFFAVVGLYSLQVVHIIGLDGLQHFVVQVLQPSDFLIVVILGGLLGQGLVKVHIQVVLAQIQAVLLVPALLALHIVVSRSKVVVVCTYFNIGLLVLAVGNGQRRHHLGRPAQVADKALSHGTGGHIGHQQRHHNHHRNHRGRDFLGALSHLQGCLFAAQCSQLALQCLELLLLFFFLLGVALCGNGGLGSLDFL